jgi:uncharacterized membrane protein
MKSRAHIESHPIHPMLVSLPIGVRTASLACDLALPPPVTTGCAGAQAT